MRANPPAIGHFKLTKIRPQHLNRLYVSLAEGCIKHSADNARAKIDLGALLAERKISRAALSQQATLSPSTVTTACWGQIIRQASAKAIASALSISRNYLTTSTAKENSQSRRFCSITDLFPPFYHRRKRKCSSPITLPAVQRFPKQSAVNYFQPEEITATVEALEFEPLKWRLITHLLLVTRCRRGEIMGLKWDRVHLDKYYLTIDNNLRYSKACGI